MDIVASLLSISPLTLILLMVLLPWPSSLTLLLVAFSIPFSFSWRTVSRPAPMPMSNSPIFDTISQSPSSLLAAAESVPPALVALEPRAIVTRILSRRCSIAESTLDPSFVMGKVSGEEEERKKARASRREKRVILETLMGWERRSVLERSEY